MFTYLSPSIHNVKKNIFPRAMESIQNCKEWKCAFKEIPVYNAVDLRVAFTVTLPLCTVQLPIRAIRETVYEWTSREEKETFEEFYRRVRMRL